MDQKNSTKSFKNIIYNNSMNKSDLEKLDKSQLIQMLLKQDLEMKKLKLRNPTPAPRKNVKQMVQDYEDNIIEPPPEFRDDYKPTPLPRTKIEQVDIALKGYTVF